MAEIATFISEAKALLGEKCFTSDADLLDPWLTDWRGRFTGRAIGLASPRSTQEVAEFVKLCAAHRVPIVPQGGNSGMSGGATPDESGEAVILSLRHMNSVRRLDLDAQQIVLDAGVILQNLHEIAEAEGLRFPLTLGGKGSATIGGLISTNAGGTQVLRHGTMRAQVLGVEAVLADGQIFNGLTALKKDNRGFDLKQLLIGSEGTLGIVTAATLRLLPGNKERIVAWIGLTDIHAARAMLVKLEKMTPDELEGFEVMPAHCLESVLDFLPDARSPIDQITQWHALIELVTEPEKIEALREKFENVLATALNNDDICDAVIAANERQADEFWLLRESVAPAERIIGPAMQHDISVPVDRMPSFIEEVSPIIENAYAGTRCAAFGHLGDGNIHFHVLAPEGAIRGEWEERQGKAISAQVHDLVTQWGGSISAEHGIGQMKRDELGRLADPVVLGMMQSVKRSLDPQGILNPGKLLPLA